MTDQHGAFAMGTFSGIRTRKYHGFYMGIPGRAETAFLVDFEFIFNGQSIWPHRYASGDSSHPGVGGVIHPDPLKAASSFEYEPSKSGPRWRWDFVEGRLWFAVDADTQAGGISLRWKWQSTGQNTKPSNLEIRPFWAMRPLHGMGGESWTQEPVEPRKLDEKRRLIAIAGQSGQDAYLLMEGAFEWKSKPVWHEHFFYSEEAERGYLAQENLFSAGIFSLDLRTCTGAGASWRVAESAQNLLKLDARHAVSHGVSRVAKARVPALDFVLKEPAGIVAGFPWFGEWGRDTFISLPGIAMARIAAGDDPEEVWQWAQEILLRWGQWIRMTGMIPNLIEKGGSHQWDSADGTLWWCHALASLWTFSLGGDGFFPDIEKKFRDLLNTAVTSLGAGRHLFLKISDSGLLEVTEPHATWMDARVDGAAVTPRLGLLPEINALWFQARCLQWMWSETVHGQTDQIERLGRLALACKEADRPNTIFLHSIPLAPSFVLKDSRALGTDLKQAMEHLWTPVGLRTLSPRNPAYRPRCIGDQTARDLAYHQGSPWGWLGGHFEMARHRWVGSRIAGQTARASKDHEMKVPTSKELMPVAGHMAELFDAEPPFTPRGTPAQAWSLACFEEASARRKERVDAKLTQVLAVRWMNQLGIKSETVGGNEKGEREL